MPDAPLPKPGRRTSLAGRRRRAATTRWRLLLWLLAVVAELSASVSAAPPVAFEVAIDARGRAAIHFLVGNLPRDPNQLIAAAAHALELNLADIDLDVDYEKRVATMDAVSSAAFPHNFRQVQFTIRPEPLLALARELKSPATIILIMHPAAGYSACPAAQRTTPSGSPQVKYAAIVPAAKRSPAKITGEFGFGTRDAARAAIGIIFAAASLAAARRLSIHPATRLRKLLWPAACLMSGAGFLLCGLPQMLWFWTNASSGPQKFLATGAGLGLFLWIGAGPSRMKLPAAFRWVPAILFIIAGFVESAEAGARTMVWTWLACGALLGLAELSSELPPRPLGRWREALSPALFVGFVSAAAAWQLRESRPSEFARDWWYAAALLGIIAMLGANSFLARKRAGRFAGRSSLSINPPSADDSGPSQPGGPFGNMAPQGLTLAAPALAAPGLQPSHALERINPASARSVSCPRNGFASTSANLARVFLALAAGGLFCFLFGLRFDFAHGDDGWAVLVLAAAAAAVDGWILRQ